jgi:hypothetical protein
MRRTVALLLFGVVLVQWMSCTQDNFVDYREEVVPATIDLVTGFQGWEVRLYFNDQLRYIASFSADGAPLPLSGPCARFNTTLPRGPNQVVIEYRPRLSTGTYTKRTAFITVGYAEKYFLGLILQSDSFNINVQDTPFLYL